MLDAFNSILNNELSFLRDKRLLVAISGGIDSVVLTQLCLKAHLDLTLAHCNFKLRGAESDADESFVKDLADNLGLEVFIQGFNTEKYMTQNKVSLQMAARELRYKWFQELSSQLHFDYILTAHHADDNLETFLINFTRGTGINGLTGIPILNENIVRPLLPFSRDEILQLATESGWNWREDTSNKSRKYLRNKLRHEVVPILKAINPNLIGSFQSTINNLNETGDIVEESLNAVAKRAITHLDDNEIHYKVSEFKKVNNSRAYLHEMFKDYGFTEWDDVLNLLDAKSGKYVESESHRLIKHREVLILTDVNPPVFRSITIKEGDECILFPHGQLKFNKIQALRKTKKSEVYLDENKVEFPLVLRIWKAGDSFVPSGMSGTKKISKFLKDEKCSLTEKERTWVLCSGNDVIWVVGKRANNKCVATSDTESILHIQLEA
ncbi:tRNA lysidine(34) synthetase TilS [Winogradskyella aurantiaca]|uniref:tRNA lysidine(34) synthetase TilS n=1 Tax=Winogradskyella aurantiaca TaxID=2219558 RepID=UPI000E1E0B41|nr:tRNA lysidine(34) synthetase TilS [Winogradskyella aurantiaca]